MAAADGDELVAALKAEAVELTRQLSVMPELVARRREVVRRLAAAIGVAQTAQELGVSRQAVYKLIRE